jgi:hypothetical protein
VSAVLDPRPLDPRELQGNILRGYRRQKVRHLLLAVADGAAARAWLGAVVSGDAALAPQITSEAHWGDQKPDFCFNLGITSEGLRALGLPESVMASFPGEFNEGMAARAVKLGDTGASAPSHWPAAFRETDQLHLIATIHADDIAHLDAVHQRVQTAGQGRAWQVRGAVDGGSYKGDEVHFGYRDNISQPRFVGIHDPADYPDAQPLAPLGTVLLGKATAFEDLVFTPPQPAQLGLLGSFSAFRVLAQDVVGFEAYLDSAATELLAHPLGHELLDHASAWPAQSGLTRFAALREVLAAKMCGRWRTTTRTRWTPRSRCRWATSITRTTPGACAAPTARTCGAATRVAAPSCSAWPTTRAASCAAAFPTARPTTALSRTTATNAVCSATSSAPIWQRSSRPSTTTG